MSMLVLADEAEVPHQPVERDLRIGGLALFEGRQPGRIVELQAGRDLDYQLVSLGEHASSLGRHPVAKRRARHR
jgi:hypothetical protein